MYTNPKDNDDLPENPHGESPNNAEGAPESPLPPEPELKPKPARRAPERFMQDTASKIEAAYAQALAEGRITADQLSKIIWLYQIGKNEGDNRESLSKRLGVSYTFVKQLFEGKYQAIESAVSRIEEFQRIYLQRLQILEGAFVETSLSKKIWQICDAARAYSTLIPIYGDPQTGKSEALKEYARRNNHGSTIYVTTPELGMYTEFLRALNEALGEPSGAQNATLHKTPFERLDRKKLLIIDELTQAFIVAGNGSIRLRTIEYLRLLHDKTGCAMILCGTNGVREAIEKGRHKGVLEQTRRRAMAVLQLPPLLPRADQDLIAAAYGLPPASDDVHDLRVEIIKSTGLRAYVLYLRSASAMANKRSHPISWRHFVAAHDILAKLSTKAEADE